MFEKNYGDYLVKLLKRFSGLYFVEVLGFCCMDSHFHFLIRMHSDSNYTDKEIQERFEKFHGEKGDGKDFIDYEIDYLRKKFSSLSELVREIKHGVADAGDRLREYRRFLYETGAIDSGKGQQIKQEVVEKERKKDFKITRADRFKSRSRYFSDSGIIGTKAFVQENYQRIKHLFQSTKETMGTGK